MLFTIKLKGAELPADITVTQSKMSIELEPEQMQQQQDQDLEVTEDAVGPWNEEEYEEETYDTGMLCAQCHQEEPMYPRKDSDAYCHILCADCYWDEDYYQKHQRSIYYALHPGEYEAYRKKAAETLGVEYIPLPKEWHDECNAKKEKQEWYQRWVKPVLEKKEKTEELSQSESK